MLDFYFFGCIIGMARGIIGRLKEMIGTTERAMKTIGAAMFIGLVRPRSFFLPDISSRRFCKDRFFERLIRH